jgi:hypothetical protein
MHFDDRLETVLRLPDSGDGLVRIQFRQLVDLLGRIPANATSPAIEAAFSRLGSLSQRITATDRARLMRQPLQPVTNARLISMFAEAEPEVASAVIGTAELDDAQWLDLVPAMPIRARGILRHRRDLSPAVEDMLERLGIHDRGLPPAALSQDITAPPAAEEQPFYPAGQDQAPPPSPVADDAPYVSDDVLELLDFADEPAPPTRLDEWAQARAAREQNSPSAHPDRQADAGIGAIVRRIEEFRKARGTKAPNFPDTDAPTLPLSELAGGSASKAGTIDFTTDVYGRIDWAEGPYAPAVIGFSLPGLASDQSPSAPLAFAVRQHFPFTEARVRIEGAPSVEGDWQADGVPRFEPAGGRFSGYCGRLRRLPPPAELESAARRRREAERMREILHELRTPANAIQVAAEIIQQQLYGPAPHEYRALAASIASDCAHILAGFEELDRLVKLETGALQIEPGQCDLAVIIRETILRLRSWMEPRRSGFVIEPSVHADHLPVAIEAEDAEPMAWRLFAALAGATAPDEVIDLSCWHEANTARVRVSLPQSLSQRSDAELFGNLAPEQGQSLSAGMFGIGFTLRLAAAEAAAAGGSLIREANALYLSLPSLTLADTHNSNFASFSN